MPKLKTTVHINNDQGNHVFGPDDELPDWAVEKLQKDGTPDIWAEGDEPEPYDPESPVEYAKRNPVEETNAWGEKVEGSVDTASPNGGSEGEAAVAPDGDLAGLNKPQLEEIAQQRGIDTKGKSKDQIIEALRGQ